MKCWILLAVVAVVAPAQTPDPKAQAQIPGDTVVAKVDGKPLTAGELRDIITAAPGFLAAYKAKPDETIRDYFVLRALAEQADKLKLADQSPWKEQIQNARINILANATLSHELNGYSVPEDQVQKYFAANQARFEQATVKVIKIAFNPGAKAKGTSDDALANAAQGVIAATHNPNRSEADAKKLAEDLVHQARGGVDFSTLAAQYSDDEESKKAGGDFGVIKINSSYPPELKNAALALKPGEVSNPVKISTFAYYIVRCEKKSAQTLQEVHTTVVFEIRQQHTDEVLKQLQQRYLPVIEKPEALIQIGIGK
jgi:parvulin-like peptidyl-prolyl isomerase